MLGGCASDPGAASRAWGDLAVAAERTPVEYRLQLASTATADEEVDLWADSENALPEEWDPLELVNRLLFAINQTIDLVLIRPLAVTYSFWVPVELQDVVRDFTRNIRGPVIFFNDVFQGSWDRADTTATRFLVNTTVGVGGLFDVAKTWGYEYHDEDFGQTLGTYGAGPGPYLVLPLLGPSSLRDASGRVVDTVIDPFTWLLPTSVGVSITASRGIDTRARLLDTLDELERDSVDFYARLRSLYLQSRANDIRNGAAADDIPAPGLSGGTGLQTGAVKAEPR